MTLQAIGVAGIGEIRAGDDLAAVIAQQLPGTPWPDGTTGLVDGDIGANASRSGNGDTQTPAAPPIASIVETQRDGSLGPGAAIPSAPTSPRARRSGT